MCSKCNKEIAFKIVENHNNKYFLGNSILKEEEQKIKEKIEEILNNNNILNENEETITFFVIGELQK